MKGIVFSKSTIGYLPLPKCACTSVKEAIFQSENGKPFDEEAAGCHIHDYYYTKKLKELADCQYRLIIIRDPIKRFLSAYSNRVTYWRELSRKYISKRHPNLVSEIPVFNPGLGQFLDHFSTYMKVNTMSHHMKPIVEHFDQGLDFFTHVFPMENIKDFEGLVLETTQSNFTLGRFQTGGQKYYLGDLSKSQLDFLLDYYDEDYHLMADFYTKDQLIIDYNSGF